MATAATGRAAQAGMSSAPKRNFRFALLRVRRFYLVRSWSGAARHSQLRLRSGAPPARARLHRLLQRRRSGARFVAQGPSPLPHPSRLLKNSSMPVFCRRLKPTQRKNKRLRREPEGSLYPRYAETRVFQQPASGHRQPRHAARAALGAPRSRTVHAPSP